MTEKREENVDSSADVVFFQQVINEEKLAVADRRSLIKSSGKLESSSKSLVALSLSGGGIRSASICLGACQALHDLGVWDDFDYISTVSGGSYIGSCISLQAEEQNRDIESQRDSDEHSSSNSGHENFSYEHSSLDDAGEQIESSEDAVVSEGPMQSSDTRKNKSAKFPFIHKAGAREGLAFRHLRANTSYLTTGTLAERAGTPLQVARSFIRNVVSLAPILLIAAAVYCIFYGELITSLKGMLIGGYQLPPISLNTQPNVLLSSRIIFTAFGATTSWAFVISFLFIITFFLKNERQRFVERLIVAIFVACTFFLALEGTALAVAAYDLVFSSPTRTAREDNIGNWLIGWIISGTLLLLIVSHFILRRMGGTAKLPIGKAALVVVSLGVPFLLWATFFLAVRWQINWDSSPSKFKYAVGMVNYLNNLVDDKILLFAEVPISALAHFPKMAALGFHGEHLPSHDAVHKNTIALTLLMLSVGLLWLIFVKQSNPNDSALHTIYKEKLANLFMFHIKRDAGGNENFVDASSSKISTLAKPTIPILLINGAIAGIRVNVDSADLEPSVGFTFSPYHIGYENSYCATSIYESYDDSITLASIVAISGAAVTPRMNGTLSRPASMFIAMLNLRLGYWLPNPKHYKRANKGFLDKIPKLRHLLYEVLGSDSRNEKHIYLSDGGHYENLGVLELLRRRCTLIVAVDAEHDPDFTFPSLSKLIRIARVRLGVNISLDASSVSPSRGDFSESHSAVGKIDYGNGFTGKLVYIKSSLTGDENHYILNYARGSGKFPHESTLDQFFSDRQFEAYRALGYHMTKNSIKKYINKERKNQARSVKKNAKILKEDDMASDDARESNSSA